MSDPHFLESMLGGPLASGMTPDAMTSLHKLAKRLVEAESQIEDWVKPSQHPEAKRQLDALRAASMRSRYLD